jgi:hypothetical protein
VVLEVVWCKYQIVFTDWKMLGADVNYPVQSSLCHEGNFWRQLAFATEIDRF